jgi:hypothetical protein
MTPATADGAPDPRCPGQTRALFKFRQPEYLLHALKTGDFVSSFVKGLLVLVPHGLHEAVDMMSMHMRSMLLYNICLLRVYVCYMFLYVICLLNVMCLLCV